jgi:hypothetical protein
MASFRLSAISSPADSPTGPSSASAIGGTRARFTYRPGLRVDFDPEWVAKHQPVKL